MLGKIRDILGLTSVPIDQIRTEKKKIKWDHFFLLEALAWAQRSHDPQTQCGCVLVKDKRMISTGYNGFIAGIGDDDLPNMRPYKYPWMIHSEANAIYNCAREGTSTKGATAYVTSKPCNGCRQALWQAGVEIVIYSDMNTAKMIQTDESEQIDAVLNILTSDRMTMVFIPSKYFL